MSKNITILDIKLHNIYNSEALAEESVIKKTQKADIFPFGWFAAGKN